MNESKAMLELADELKAEFRHAAFGEVRTDLLHRVEAALRSSAPQGDGRALEGMPETLGDVFPVSEMVDRLERRGAELNATAVTPNGQLMLKAAFYLKALSAPPSVALEADLTDDQIMEILRRVTKDELYEMLTCKRWKDGIDITGPTYAAERLAKEFRAALTRPQPGGAVAGTERGEAK